MKRHLKNSGSTPRARRLLIGLLYALLAALLVACSSLGEQPASHLAPVDGPAYLLTVDLANGDTQADVLSRHGGEIEVWVEGHFAVLGFTAEEAEQQGGTFRVMGTGGLEPNLQFSSEPNAIGMQGTSTLWAGGTSTLWAGGTSRIWAGGTSYLWAGGTSYLWAGGHFQWMPENTAVWKQIGLDEAHRMVANTLGAGVKVAVIDTGLDVDHPALKEALAGGYDFVDGDDDPDEEGSEADAGYGHGTNVAGIIRQIAPRATIIPYRVLGPDGSGTSDLLTAAIIRAVADGADVINLSLGGAESNLAVAKALLYAIDAGVHVVASTGDSGNETVTFPASAAYLTPFLLSLTSVDEYDLKSDFAPHHEYLVEMSSPGESIFGPAPDMKAAAWSGTSMSAPMAAGALALALGADSGAGQLRVRESQLGDFLMSNAVNIDGLNPGYEGELGSGRLDVASFLTAVLGPTRTPEAPHPGNGHGRPDAGKGSDETRSGPPSWVTERNEDRGRGHGKRGR